MIYLFLQLEDPPPKKTQSIKIIFALKTTQHEVIKPISHLPETWEPNKILTKTNGKKKGKQRNHTKSEVTILQFTTETNLQPASTRRKLHDLESKLTKKLLKFVPKINKNKDSRLLCK